MIFAGSENIKLQIRDASLTTSATPSLLLVGGVLRLLSVSFMRFGRRGRGAFRVLRGAQVVRLLAGPLCGSVEMGPQASARPRPRVRNASGLPAPLPSGFRLAWHGYSPLPLGAFDFFSFRVF